MEGFLVTWCSRSSESESSSDDSARVRRKEDKKAKKKRKKEKKSKKHTKRSKSPESGPVQLSKVNIHLSVWCKTVSYYIQQSPLQNTEEILSVAELLISQC